MPFNESNGQPPLHIGFKMHSSHFLKIYSKPFFINIAIYI